MPPLEEIVAQLAPLASTPAIVGIAIAASLIVVLRDWRLWVVALGVQAVFTGVLFTLIFVAAPQLAGLKLLVGLLLALIYFVTGAELDQASPTLPKPPESRPLWWRLLPRPALLLRVFAVLLVILVVPQLAETVGGAFGLPPVIAQAGVLLVALGLLNLGLNQEPIRIGLGLATVLMGFQLFYATVEPSLAVQGMLAAVDFAVALAVSYLALVQVATPDEAAARADDTTDEVRS